MVVAELLANSSRVVSRDFGGMALGDRRSTFRGFGGMDADMGMASPNVASVRPRSGGGDGGRAAERVEGRFGGGGGGGAGLRITNPELLSSGAAAVAHTPWDGEVRLQGPKNKK